MSQRLALITGCTRGLGRALVERFIREGITVVGCGRNLRQVEELNEQYAPEHSFYPVDVSDSEDVSRFAHIVLEELGPPDLLINNAALMNDPAKLWDVPAAAFSRLVDVNIKGVHHMIRHFVPAMVERGSGGIVNFSSGWGRSSSPDVVPYCTSKWAIEGLSQGLAQELPAGMFCVPLNPGIINTEMLQQCSGEAASAYPLANEWADDAAAFILKLSASDNGQPVTVA